MVCFDFFFLLLWNFLLRVGKERNGTIIFILSLSQPFPTYFGWKWRHNGFFFLFFEFFLLFFLEFSITRQIGKKRNDSFYFLPFSAFSNLFWLEIKPQWFFFFVLVMEFSITRRVETKRNDNFYFLYFSAFSNLFWVEMKPQWYVLIFFFFSCYGIFYYVSGRNETER